MGPRVVAREHRLANKRIEIAKWGERGSAAIGRTRLHQSEGPRRFKQAKGENAGSGMSGWWVGRNSAFKEREAGEEYGSLFLMQTEEKTRMGGSPVWVRLGPV